MNGKLLTLAAGCLILSSCHTVKRMEFKRSLTDLGEKTINEKNRLHYLQTKNDSLRNNALIYDSVSVQLQQEIKTLQTKNDSFSTAVKRLQSKVNFKLAFLEQYDDITKQIAVLNSAVVKQSIPRTEIYTQLNRRMDESLIAGEKKVLKSMLTSAAAQQQKEAVAITKIGDSKDSLVAKGVVDSTTSTNIDNRLVKYKSRIDSLSAEIKTLNNKLESPDATKEFTYIKTRIILIDEDVNKNAKTREYSLQMIEEGLSKNTKKLFSLAAFFGPGGYIIPADKYGIAREYFLPIVDSLQKFSNKYEAVQRTASVIVDGYADATKISPNSKLYTTLSAFMHMKKPSKQDLNTALSALRAIEIRKFLNLLIAERSSTFLSVDKVTFFNFESGMGEVLPDPDITNYTANDERRRIVLIYWSVLPN